MPRLNVTINDSLDHIEVESPSSYEKRLRVLLALSIWDCEKADERGMDVEASVQRTRQSDICARLKNLETSTSRVRRVDLLSSAKTLYRSVGGT